MPSSTPWRLRHDRLLWFHDEEASLLFNPASGQTHLLNPSAAFALEQLAQGPASAGQLAAREEATWGMTLEILALLRQLHRLGLVEPA